MFKYYIVVDGVKKAIRMVKSTATEQEAEDFMRSVSDIESIWLGLEDGSVISVNKLTGSVYFIAEPHN